MDVLSVLSSVITVLQLSNEIIKGAKKYYKGAKNASKDIQHLLDELESFNHVLVGLQVITARVQGSETGSVNGGGVRSSECLPNIRKMLEPNAPLSA